MTEQEMWAAYQEACPESRDAHYEAWSYGCEPDLLAALTVSGTKTATASAYPAYVHEDAALPKVGDHSVILNAAGEAVCVIRDLRVEVVPFNKVSAAHAAAEGEGDRSLTYWREVHAKAFTMELAEFGQTFREDMPVVCETFAVVYPVREA